MRSINLKICFIFVAFLVSMVGCSKSDIRVEESTVILEQNTSSSNDEFIKKAEEKGINESMLRTFDNLGYTHEEILNLTPEKISEIFAPGTYLDGAGFEPNENQINELRKLEIDTEMSVILYNLGYEYEEMLELTSKEIDFIFPNTELVSNLINKGFSEQEVQQRNVFESGKSYKEIIKEALKR